VRRKNDGNVPAGACSDCCASLALDILAKRSAKSALDSVLSALVVVLVSAALGSVLFSSGKGASDRSACVVLSVTSSCIALSMVVGVCTFTPMVVLVSIVCCVLGA
jgi:hypothetical protein